MSTTEAVQSRSHRNGMTAQNARPRVPSSRHTSKPSSDREIVPEDSASNAPSVASSRPALSSRSRANGVQRSSYEKRTERTRTTTITQKIRTVSPVKPTEGDDTAIPLTNRIPSAEEIPEKKKKAEPPWKPEAYLVSRTSAPLARRVCDPPSSASLPQALEPIPLRQLSPESQEGAIMEDLVFAFMGYEGQYLRYSHGYDPAKEKSRLRGPSYSILPGLDPSLRDLTTTVLKMATHYSAVESSIEILSRDEFGMINHALCAAIRKLLREYTTLLAQLEHQVLTNPSFTLHVLHLQILPTMHMMLQLYTIAMEMLRRNRLLDADIYDDADEFHDDDKFLDLLREMGEPALEPKRLCLGGNTLRLLTDRLALMSGDPAARDLFEGLLRDASYPYVAMLNDWLHRGLIKDRYAEFLIKEQKHIRREHLERDFTDQYWDKRYTIRHDAVPRQLETVKDKILLAGKYLNVVRECGGVSVGTVVQDAPKSFEDPRFLDNINDAYTHANSSLLNLLLTTFSLPERLRSVKHYFFLDRSEFFSSFLAQSRDELRKPWGDINIPKLQSLLDLALRQPGSIAAQDPFKEDIRIQMNDQTLTSFLESIAAVQGLQGGEEFDRRKLKTPAERAAQAAKDQKANDEMTGFQALEFAYSVPFPVSLVISSKTMVRYQILFRYLVSLRHVEDTLVTTWQDHTKSISWTNRSSNKRVENWKRRAWSLRGRMLNFVQQYIYYCTLEVIEPHWNRFMSRVNGSEKAGPTSLANAGQSRYKTVDELMVGHVDILDTCLKECCLINTRLLKLINKLVGLCEGFCRHTPGFTRTLLQADNSLIGDRRALVALSIMFPPSSANARPRTPQVASITTSATTRPGSSHSNAHAIPVSPDISGVPERYRAYNPAAITNLEATIDTYEKHFNRYMETLLESLDYYAANETVALSKLCAVLSWANEKNVEVPQEFGTT